MRAQANFSTDCRGMQAQLTGLGSLIRLLDPQLSAFLVRSCTPFRAVGAAAGSCWRASLALALLCHVIPPLSIAILEGIFWSHLMLATGGGLVMGMTTRMTCGLHCNLP